MPNTYGLVYTDIVNSFSQADVSDFAVGAVNGQTIIEKEIEFQALKLDEVTPSYLKQLAEKVDLEVVTVDVSGNFMPGLYAIPASLEAWIVPRDYMPCSINDFYGGTCGMLASAPTQATITSLGNNSYHLDSTFDSHKQKLVVSYQVDQTLSDFGILKSLLRDMVCCSLGNRLYPTADGDKWSIVKYYCEEADKYLELLESGKLNNSLGLNLLFKRNSWASVRIVRG
jgi:hypothetical protein